MARTSRDHGKDAAIRTLPLDAIVSHAAWFVEFARAYPQLRFEVTAIGCGLAGYVPAQIAPLFKGAPANCTLPAEFVAVLELGR